MPPHHYYGAGDELQMLRERTKRLEAALQQARQQAATEKLRADLAEGSARSGWQVAAGLPFRRFG